jgi:hypothetical protein
VQVNAPSAQQGLSAGAIAGIVIGSVVGGLLLIGLLVWLYMKYGRKDDSEFHVFCPCYVCDVEKFI